MGCLYLQADSLNRFEPPNQSYLLDLLFFFWQFKLFPGEISAVQHRQEFRGKGLVVIDHFFSPDGLAELC